ncbi:hypothetical protein Lepto7375DRAFT_8395 [Leptolyngbya sp. PCC 7375]|nr:hypothetical protein Lepto7375DRAFT_8395 [Leptolyngbya sp. PCC 7375]
MQNSELSAEMCVHGVAAMCNTTPMEKEHRYKIAWSPDSSQQKNQGTRLKLNTQSQDYTFLLAKTLILVINAFLSLS